MEECAKEKREIQLLSGVSTVHIKLKYGKKKSLQQIWKCLIISIFKEVISINFFFGLIQCSGSSTMHSRHAFKNQWEKPWDTNK